MLQSPLHSADEAFGERALSGIELTITPKVRDLGGFHVRRALPDSRRKLVGPFIFFDHMGPAEFAPGQGINVRAHPHIGIATITYLFEGEIMHRDSLGYEQRITPGAVNWMTAGSGIVHSERTPQEIQVTGSRVHGIQAWVALPLDQEECDPAFDHYPADQIPAVPMDGGTARIVIGSAYGAVSPVKTASDMLYVEIDVAAGSTVPVPGGIEELAVYVVEGGAELAGSELAAGTMAILTGGSEASIGVTADSKLMLAGGDAIDGERTIWWNFVSSSKERIERAKQDWRDRRFDPVPGEREFIPLPEN